MSSDNFRPTLEDYGDPISEITYMEEDGSIVNIKEYAVNYTTAKNDIAISSTRGSGWRRTEKSHAFEGNNVMDYYIEAEFSWDGSSVSVGSVGAGNDTSKYYETTNHEIVHDSGSSWGTKYKTVAYTFTTTNGIGLSSNFSVKVGVDANGKTK